MIKSLFKSFFSLVLVCCLTTTISAQNWTATDTEGVSHNIQEYLDNGVTVLVDLSAHWCGPCWSWHTSGIMDKAYHEYGPDGTGELMVFFIDASSPPDYPASTMDLLMGVGQTQGNWLEGTPYPVIGPNNQGVLVGNSYNFNAFPTLFVHRPGSTTAVEIDRNNFEAFMDDWRNLAPAAFGKEQNDATLLTHDRLVVCSGATPEIVLSNNGTEPLTSAEIEIRQDGNVLETISWTGNLSPYADEYIDLGFTMSETTSIEATVLKANGFDDVTQGNTESYEFKLVEDSSPTSVVVINVATDFYSVETSWRLETIDGSLVASAGYVGNANGGGADANMTHTHTAVLSENECYVFKLFDSYGDGMQQYNGNPAGPFGYEIIDSNGGVILTTMAANYNFGSEDRGFMSTETFSTSILNPQLAVASMDVTPNPAQDVINLSFFTPENMDANIQIFNVVGSKVKDVANKSFAEGDHNMQVNISDLPNGIYNVTVVSGDKATTKKFVIAK